MISVFLKGAKIFSRMFLLCTVLIGAIYLFFALSTGSATFSTLSATQIETERIKIYEQLPLMQKESEQFYTMYKATVCGIVGEFCSEDPLSSDNNIEKSLFGLISKGLVAPYINPPASGLFALNDSLTHSNLIPQAYAAEGIGFASLKPFQNIWRVFRDISYLILVLILIIIGFMIMFRMKLDPQTVISVESALPKIVVALILITFSYAIAGFLIDLMYVLIIIVTSFIGGRVGVIDVVREQNIFVNAPSTALIPSDTVNLGSIAEVANSMVNILPDWMNQTARLLAGGVATYFYFHTLHNSFMNLFTFTGLWGAGDIASLILRIIISVSFPIIAFGFGYNLLLQAFLFIAMLLTLLFLFFRILFLLIFAYIKILLLVIFAPIILLAEAIPGVGSFKLWFKHLFVELLSFPLVVLFLILAKTIMSIQAGPGVLWKPPFLYDFNPQAFTIIIGAAIIFAMPQLIGTVKGLFGVEGGLGLGPGIFFSGLGTAIGAPQAIAGVPIIGSRIIPNRVATKLKRWGLLQPTMTEQMTKAFEEAHSKGHVS